MTFYYTLFYYVNDCLVCKQIIRDRLWDELPQEVIRKPIILSAFAGL